MSVSFYIENSEDLLDLNVANANFRSIVDILALDVHSDDYCGSIEPKDLLEKISNAIPQIGIRLDVQDDNVYSMGLDMDRIQNYLDTLKEMAEIAAKMERKITFC